MFLDSILNKEVRNSGKEIGKNNELEETSLEFFKLQWPMRNGPNCNEITSYDISLLIIDEQLRNRKS